jgi:F0F1-type ATP synthase delta subunit
MKKGLDKKLLKILDEISNSKEKTFYLKRFLDYLQRKRMKHYLPFLVKLFKKKRVAPRIVKIELTREIEKETKKELEQLVRKKIHQEPIVNYKINPELIGGFKIKSQNFLIDYSIRRYLDQIFKI